MLSQKRRDVRPLRLGEGRIEGHRHQVPLRPRGDGHGVRGNAVSKRRGLVDRRLGLDSLGPEAGDHGGGIVGDDNEARVGAPGADLLAEGLGEARRQGAPRRRSALNVGSGYRDPQSFLLAVMNDESASARQRIAAAKALLPYFADKPAN